jgi:DNA (cytosine-5)-methyltransferase 1
MDETDENFYKVKNALIEKFYKGKDRADSQLYKIAGNSIVKRVLKSYIKILLKDYINQD